MSNIFSQRSEARFEKVAAEIRRVFAADPTAAEEAIELARSMRTLARAEAIAKSTAIVEPTVPMEFIDLFRCDDGEVSLPDRSVTEDLSTVAEPADDPIGAFVKAQSDGLNETLVADEDPGWTAPLKPFEKRVEFVDVDGERRASYYDEYGSLVEFKIMSLPPDAA